MVLNQGFYNFLLEVLMQKLLRCVIEAGTLIAQAIAIFMSGSDGHAMRVVTS